MSVVLEHVSKRFGDFLAIDDISLEIGAGEVVAVLGENGAGKSTLMKVLSGFVRPDAGRVRIDGREVTLRSPRDAWRYGVGMVPQHIQLVPGMTGVANAALESSPSLLSAAALSQVRDELRARATELDMDVDVDVPVEELSLGDQQRIEILKLLRKGAQRLILDEPSAVLTPLDWRGLASAIATLREHGHTVLMVTHKISEARDVAERAVVLRKGRVVGDVALRDFGDDALARMMVGRPVGGRSRRTPTGAEPSRDDRPVIAVDGVEVSDEAGASRLAGLSLVAYEGEILGVAGVEGNGQTELFQVLAGERVPAAGTVTMRDAGTPKRGVGPQEVAVIPADRAATALALEMTVAENLRLRDWSSREYSRFGMLRSRRLAASARSAMRAFEIADVDPDTPVAQLSGGTQQKIVLARELHGRPRVVLAAEPTRGLDVGAREYVWEQLSECRAAGAAIIVVSSDLDELLRLSDRIVVLFRGRAIEMPSPCSVDDVALAMTSGSHVLSASGS